MRVHSLSVSHLQQSVSAPMQEMLELDAVSACSVSGRSEPTLTILVHLFIQCYI